MAGRRAIPRCIAAANTRVSLLPKMEIGVVVADGAVDGRSRVMIGAADG
jgi:hypothetical protein